MNGCWVRSKRACDFYGVHANTLRTWANNNLIEYKTTEGGQRIYFVGARTDTRQLPKKDFVIYTRVSSAKQKDDLERQQIYASSRFPGYRLVKDIGSGLNFKRKNLLKLMDQVSEGKIDTVVVTSKDRLCRFGFEWMEWFFTRYDTKLVVLDTVDKSPEQEFTEDILAILQVFACRWNGKRSYSVKKQEDKITVEFNANQASQATC